jgi:hypothetical protein
VVAVLTVVGVLLRPPYQPDDWGYMIRAAHVVLDPTRVISLREPGVLPPIDFPNPYNLAYTSEFFSAYVAHLTGLSFLTVYHVIVRALFALLLPLVWFLALARFVANDERIGVIAATAAVASLFVAGAHFNGMAGHTLGRLWLNKGILVAIMFPAALRYLLDYLERGTIADWLKLALLGVVAGGLGLNSFYLWPAYLATLSLAFLGQQWWLACSGSDLAAAPASRRAWPLRHVPLTRLALAALSQVYVVGVYLAYQALRGPAPGTWRGTGVENYFRTYRSFTDLLAYVFKSPLAPEFLVPFFAIVLMAFLYRGRYRPFVLAWLAVLAVWTSLLYWLLVWFSGTQLLSAYWRFAYLLPFPLASGLAAAGLTMRGTQRPGAVATATIVGSIVLAIAGAFAVPAARPLTGPLATTWPSPSISTEDLALMAAIDRQAPPGALLAPEWVGEVMPVLRPSRPQIVTFVQVAAHYAEWSKDWEPAIRLVKTLNYLVHVTDADRDAFVQVVTTYRPAAVIFQRSAKAAAVKCTMANLGYREASISARYFIVFTRSAATEPADDC